MVIKMELCIVGLGCIEVDGSLVFWRLGDYRVKVLGVFECDRCRRKSLIWFKIGRDDGWGDDVYYWKCFECGRERMEGLKFRRSVGLSIDDVGIRLSD